jgi:hypothetical protein
MTLAPFQFPLYGLSDQVRALLAVLQNGVDPLKGALRKPGRGLFVVDLFASHPRNINDIMYVDKPYHM